MSFSPGSPFKAPKRELLYRAPAAANKNQNDPKDVDANEGLFEDETLAQPGY